LGRQYLAKHGISTEKQVVAEQGLQVLPATTESCSRENGSRSGSRTLEIPLSQGIPPPGADIDNEAIALPMSTPTPTIDKKDREPDYWTDSSESTPAGAQILGVAILEFGILFHSVSD
jgi:hypothetical protein